MDHTGLSALIVEDNASLAATLVDVVRERAREVDHAGSVAEATSWLETRQPGLVVLDFKLPDGTGLDVLNLLGPRSPQPVVIAVSGEATPEDSFRLARAGVRCFLRKPFGLERIRAALEEALDTSPDPLVEVRAVVGHKGIKELEFEVRRTMVSEALAKSGGSVRGAAALLGISRQLLQHILKTPEFEGQIPRPKDPR
jgi:two-component system, response regulator RegA